MDPAEFLTVSTLASMATSAAKHASCSGSLPCQCSQPASIVATSPSIPTSHCSSAAHASGRAWCSAPPRRYARRCRLETACSSIFRRAGEAEVDAESDGAEDGEGGESDADVDADDDAKPEEAAGETAESAVTALPLPLLPVAVLAAPFVLRALLCAVLLLPAGEGIREAAPFAVTAGRAEADEALPCGCEGALGEAGEALAALLPGSHALGGTARLMLMDRVVLADEADCPSGCVGLVLRDTLEDSSEAAAWPAAAPAPCDMPCDVAAAAAEEEVAEGELVLLVLVPDA